MSAAVAGQNPGSPFVRVDAPFTAEQVVRLADWQASDYVHPFTCPDRGDRRHLPGDVLEPTVAGMICRRCDYLQTWVHDCMVDGVTLNAAKQSALFLTKRKYDDDI